MTAVNVHAQRRRKPPSHVASHVAACMLLLFLVVALADFVMLPDASPARAMRRTDEQGFPTQRDCIRP